MSWSRIYYIDVGVGKLLMMKCSQVLSNWINWYLLFSFCKFWCTLYLRICFCLKRNMPWLEFRIKFIRDSVRSFQRALVGFNNIWIFFIFRYFEFLCLKYLVHPSKWRVELGAWEVLLFFRSGRNRIFFRTAYIWPMNCSLEKSVWFTNIFLPLKESLTLFQIWIFLLYLHLFCPNWIYPR